MKAIPLVALGCIRSEKPFTMQEKLSSQTCWRNKREKRQKCYFNLTEGQTRQECDIRCLKQGLNITCLELMKYRKRHDLHMHSSSGTLCWQQELRIFSTLQDLVQTLSSSKIKSIEFEICDMYSTAAGKLLREVQCCANSRACREHLVCKGKKRDCE